MKDRLLSVDEVLYRDGISHIKRDAEGNFRIVGIIDSLNRLVQEQADEKKRPPVQGEVCTGRQHHADRRSG